MCIYIFIYLLHISHIYIYIYISHIYICVFQAFFLRKRVAHRIVRCTSSWSCSHGPGLMQQHKSCLDRIQRCSILRALKPLMLVLCALKHPNFRYLCFDPALLVNSLKCVQPADVPFTRRSSSSSLAVRATSAIMPLGDVEGYHCIQKTGIPLGIPKALVSIGGIAYFNEPPLKAMSIYIFAISCMITTV